MTPLCSEAATQGRTGWKARPFTRADLDSNLVSMVVDVCEREMAADGSFLHAYSKSHTPSHLILQFCFFHTMARVAMAQSNRPDA